MIKVKIFMQSYGYKHYHNSSKPIADYLYCIYLFGFLIHSVLLKDVDPREINKMFPKNKIIE